jgi:selenocysteine lyase/cysteine desulfurase
METEPDIALGGQMSEVNRRHFVLGAAAMRGAASGAAGTSISSGAKNSVDFASLRADFPSIEGHAYFNCGGYHPLNVYTAKAVQQHIDYCLRGPGLERLPVGEEEFLEVRTLFGKLINAKPIEIGFVMSTLVGENTIVEGLDIARSGGNVDFEKVIDSKTKLVAITLASNINGHIADVKTISELAHARGAYLYADIVQAAGCIPVDMRKMGIDFAAAGTYKWLMGMTGMAFLYVRENLLDVLRTPHFGDGQYVNFEFHRFPGSPPGKTEVSYEERPGAARFEVGQLPFTAIAGQRESLKYILRLGVENIQNHAQPLVQRLRKEVPRFGYPGISPEESRTPIASFLVERPAELAAKLRKANVEVKIKWKQMRITPSVFHNQGDIDWLLNALG